jgi:hypothetical protein
VRRLCNTAIDIDCPEVEHLSDSSLERIAKYVDMTKFTMHMNKESRGTNNPAALSVLMLVCPTYSVNHNRCPKIPHTTFVRQWSHIVGVIQDICDSFIATQVLQMRSATGYMVCMGVQPYQDSDLLCRSAMCELTSRQARIDSLSGPPIRTDLNDQDVDVIDIEYDGLDYYLSISQCITSVLGLNSVIKACSEFTECSHDESSKRPCTDIYNNKRGTLCLECGLNQPCDITVNMFSCTIALFDEQCMRPKHFMDSQGYLPKCVAEQWKQFFMNIRPCSKNTRCIHMSRGCIKVGHVKYSHYSFITWIVRPTVSYSQWRCTSYMVDVHTLRDYIRNVYRTWRPFNDTELSISLCRDDCNSVQISGDMAAIYIDNVQMSRYNITTTCTSLGMAGSTLRFQIIDHSVPIPVPIDIACSIQLLRSVIRENTTYRGVILNDHVTHMKVRVRTLTNNRPAIIFGMNGGMQYNGNVEHIAKTYYTVLQFVSTNMNSTEFISSMMRSNTMVEYMYPSGISRSSRERHT